MSDWTEELKQQVIDAYVDANPTTETTLDIIKDLAEEFDKTANGVRMILVKAQVYVKKVQTSSSEAKGSGTTTKRVNKAEEIGNLKRIIKDAGKDVNDDICDRLTGKAAVYFAGLIG